VAGGVCHLGLNESGSGGEDGAVTGVETGAEEENRSNAPDHLGEVGGFLGSKRAVEQGRCGFVCEFTVTEPLLEDLVSAERVIPDVDGHG